MSDRSEGQASARLTRRVQHRPVPRICICFSTAIRNCVSGYCIARSCNVLLRRRTFAGQGRETSYSLAACLASGHGYRLRPGLVPFTPVDTPTAHWSFLHSPSRQSTAAGAHPGWPRLAQAVVAAGVLMPWCTWRLMRRAGFEEPVALVAALAAVYPGFVLCRDGARPRVLPGGGAVVVERALC